MSETQTQYPQVRVSPSDYDWLKARADAHHRTIIGELSAVRDLIDLFENRNGIKMDILPHPENAQVVPVAEP